MSNPKIIGNHRRGYMGHGLNGVGTEQVPVEQGWAAVTGKANDVAYLMLGPLLVGGVNQGVFFQSEVPVTVDFTLCNPGMAMSSQPDTQGMVMWDGAQAVPADVITAAKYNVFTTMRITFGGAGGTCYIGVL